MIKRFGDKLYSSKYTTYTILYNDENKMFCVGEWSVSCCGFLKVSQYFKNPVPCENIIRKLVNRYDYN